MHFRILVQTIMKEYECRSSAILQGFNKGAFIKKPVIIDVKYDFLSGHAESVEAIGDKIHMEGDMEL